MRHWSWVSDALWAAPILHALHRPNAYQRTRRTYPCAPPFLHSASQDDAHRARCKRQHPAGRRPTVMQRARPAGQEHSPSPPNNATGLNRTVPYPKKATICSLSRLAFAWALHSNAPPKAQGRRSGHGSRGLFQQSKSTDLRALHATAIRLLRTTPHCPTQPSQLHPVKCTGEGCSRTAARHTCPLNKPTNKQGHKSNSIQYTSRVLAPCTPAALPADHPAHLAPLHTARPLPPWHARHMGPYVLGSGPKQTNAAPCIHPARTGAGTFGVLGYSPLPRAPVPHAPPAFSPRRPRVHFWPLACSAASIPCWTSSPRRPYSILLRKCFPASSTVSCCGCPPAS